MKTFTSLHFYDCPIKVSCQGCYQEECPVYSVMKDLGNGAMAEKIPLNGVGLSDKHPNNNPPIGVYDTNRKEDVKLYTELTEMNDHTLPILIQTLMCPHILGDNKDSRQKEGDTPSFCLLLMKLFAIFLN